MLFKLKYVCFCLVNYLAFLLIKLKRIAAFLSKGTNRSSCPGHYIELTPSVSNLYHMICNAHAQENILHLFHNVNTLYNTVHVIYLYRRKVFVEFLNNIFHEKICIRAIYPGIDMCNDFRAVRLDTII